MWLGEILDVPWLLPGLGASLILAALLSGRVQQPLGTRRGLSWALIVSLGIILSATLTPSREAIEAGVAGAGGCDLSRIELPSPRDIARLHNSGMNVLLFLPLGAAIGLLPRSRGKWAIVIAAVTLPFAIETVQSLVTWLDRACQGVDVIANLTGLAVGVIAGMLAGWITARARAAADVTR